ncbi:NAD(P)H-hydrate dehydratase [Geminicoccaceae bacterium 1502E]|nr:NAD(P)H-hydrate dehydratase [Geminicoccaceae bacterium 1502E]
MPAVLPGAGWKDGVLLSPAAMARADAATIAAGTPGRALMERAGRAVARALVERFPPQPVLVLCGPGNNGGDGYVVARLLEAAGWQVRLGALVPPERLRGDAAWAAAGWRGPVATIDEALRGEERLVVDALFGAGLARPLEGQAAAAVRLLRERGAAIVAVDMPSGVDGGSGAITGDAFEAALTVTFCRPKPGHFLLPGRLHAGALVVADIGIGDEAVAACDEGVRLDAPFLWQESLRQRRPDDHKYRFGHAVVVGGGAAATGATRLAASSALGIGAGLVSVVCEPAALPVYAATLTSVMTKPLHPRGDLSRLLADRRLNAWLIGPGKGVAPGTREQVLQILRSRVPAVLDADALTVFANAPEELFAALHDACVLTPHDGEFARLFTLEGCRLARATAAARQSGAVVILKGGDTVVAAPDGRAAVMTDAPATLATAGTGDVLAGIVTGLLAQGMQPFEAGAAGVWLHAEAARSPARPLVSEELPGRLPQVLAHLQQ